MPGPHLVRYLLAIALAMNARHRASPIDPALLALLRSMQRVPSIDNRIRLLRLLVHRLAGSPGAHPVPELLELVTPPPGGADALDRILVLYTATNHAVAEQVVRLQLLRWIPELSQLLRQATFLLDYLLVVPHNRAPERWTGRRHQPRALVYLSSGELVDGHPMLLDREGRVCIDLWPLVQAVPPTEGAEPELFLFDGHGLHGALLVAPPSGLKRQDAIAEDWVRTHVIAVLEASTRMRRLRVAIPLLVVAIVAIVLGVAALALYL